MVKLSQIQKITMSAVMIVLTIILTRFLSIQNIPVIPFVRISLGPAVVILSSLVLGPFYGAVVGGAADILGILMFNNTGFAINPLFTAVYALSGLLPYFLYKLFSLIKSKRASLLILIGLFTALFIGTLVFFLLNSDITLYGGKTYHFLPLQKSAVLIAIFILSVVSLMVLYLINNYFEKRGNDINAYTIAIMVLVSEFIVKTVINSIVKTFMFEVDFLFIFASEILVLFINVQLYTFFVTFLNLLLKKIIKPRG